MDDASVPGSGGSGRSVAGETITTPFWPSSASSPKTSADAPRLHADDHDALAFGEQLAHILREGAQRPPYDVAGSRSGASALPSERRVHALVGEQAGEAHLRPRRQLRA